MQPAKWSDKQQKAKGPHVSWRVQVVVVLSQSGTRRSRLGGRVSGKGEIWWGILNFTHLAP